MLTSADYKSMHEKALEAVNGSTFSDDFSDGEITVVIVKPRPQPKKPHTSLFEDWGFADLSNWMRRGPA